MLAQVHNYIGGRWVGAAGGREMERENPAQPSQIVTRAPRSGEEEVRRAVEAARKALPGWQRLSGPARGDILYRAADILAQQVEDLAGLMADEVGKPIGEARAEARRGVAILRFFAGEASRELGEVLPASDGASLLFTVRRPVGVVGLITPWNFPLAIPLWKAAPALAFGNTVVLKPSEWSPGVAARLAQVFEAAGLPPGVLNVVHGTGSEAGRALTHAEGVDAYSFTGSVATGRQVAAAALEKGAKYQLEMGGKNPVVVARDADLSRAVEAVVSGAMRFAGQKCTATSRVIVEEAVREEFVERLVARVQSLQVRPPRDEACYLGPVAAARQRDNILRFLAGAQREGARLLVGGQALTDPALSGGYYVAPTVLDRVAPDSVLAQEEVFGPVLAVLEARDLREAIALANATRYGLSAAVFTARVDVALQAARELEAGVIRVNAETTGLEPHAPFGGLKASSSHSREQGRAAREFFTDVVTVSFTPGE